MPLAEPRPNDALENVVVAEFSGNGDAFWELGFH